MTLPIDRLFDYSSLSLCGREDFLISLKILSGSSGSILDARIVTIVEPSNAATKTQRFVSPPSEAGNASMVGCRRYKKYFPGMRLNMIPLI